MSKLDPKANKCLFLGYSPTQKGYKCYSPVTKKFHVTLNVTFFENQSFFTKNNIQGENTQECDFLFQGLPRIKPSTSVNQPVPDIPQPILSKIPEIAPEQLVPSTSQSEPTIPTSSSTQHANNTKLCVYSKEEKALRRIRGSHCSRTKPRIQSEIRKSR